MTRATCEKTDCTGGMSCPQRPAPPQALGFGARLGGWIMCGILAAGCGSGGSPAGPVARLGGSVTLDATPIAEGSLQFVPQDPGRGSPVAAAIKDGRYAAPAVPQGKVRVLISATRKTGKMIKEYSQPHEEIVSIIPEKYQGGIEITVT